MNSYKYEIKDPLLAFLSIWCFCKQLDRWIEIFIQTSVSRYRSYLVSIEAFKKYLTPNHTLNMGGNSEEKLLPVNGEKDEEEKLTQKIWIENKKLWIVAAPAIFSRFSTWGVLIITQAFIGHVGPTEFAAFAIVSTVLLRFVMSIQLGMASALETLCGQAFGAKQSHMLGIYLQRSWIVVLVSTAIVLPLFIFASPMLLLLGQEESVASMANTLSLWFIPVVFALAFSYTFQMYLQSQSKNMVVMYLVTIALVLHIFFSWLMASKLELGVAGAMGSMVLAMWIPIFGQFTFLILGGCPDTWNGFSMDAFKDLWAMFKLSLSSGAMICLELWYNSILILLTGHFKNAETAIDALSICLNITGWGMMISLGFLASAGVRVANELGAGSSESVKFSIKVVTTESLLIGIILFVVFLLFGGSFVYVFTDSPKVAEAVADLSPLLAFSVLLNSVQPVLSGVAVGAGWQNVVAYVNVACYYLIGVPLGIFLGYLIDYQVKGIWIGMIVGTAVQTFALIVITCRTDWDKQVILAQARVNKWLLPAPEETNHENEVI